MDKLRLGVLGSTRGTVMMSLIHAINVSELNAEIALVVSNQSQALILERAQNQNIPNFFISAKNLAREDYDQKISDLFKRYDVDCIVLIGYMRILSKTFVDAWKNKIINIHPSLLPQFAGMLDTKLHEAVLNSNLFETGCTVHYVTEDLDAGEILLQKKCSILPNDTVDTLKARVQNLESQALIEVIQSHSLRKQNDRHVHHGAL